MRSFMTAALMLRSISTTVSLVQRRLRISSRETTPPSSTRSIFRIWNCCSGSRTFRPLVRSSAASMSSSKGPKRTNSGILAPERTGSGGKAGWSNPTILSDLNHLQNHPKIISKSHRDNCFREELKRKWDRRHCPAATQNAWLRGEESYEHPSTFSCGFAFEVLCFLHGVPPVKHAAEMSPPRVSVIHESPCPESRT